MAERSVLEYTVRERYARDVLAQRAEKQRLAVAPQERGIHREQRHVNDDAQTIRQHARSPQCVQRPQPILRASALAAMRSDALRHAARKSGTHVRTSAPARRAAAPALRAAPRRSPPRLRLR